MNYVRQLGRAVSRFRWLYKFRLTQGWPNSSKLDRARFVILDPDVNTFTYELDNAFDLCGSLAMLTGRTEDAGRRYAQELASDTELRRRIARHSRFRAQAKTHPPLGRHTLAYCAVRLVRPSLVVEAGVKHGLGSAVLLRALEMNGREGAPGDLLSVDPDPRAGWLGYSQPHRNWELVCKTSEIALPSNLFGRSVGLLISDSLPDESVTRYEVECALGNAGEELLVMSNHHWNSVTLEEASLRGAPFTTLFEMPRHHPYPGRGVDVAYFSSR